MELHLLPRPKQIHSIKDNHLAVPRPLRVAAKWYDLARGILGDSAVISVDNRWDLHIELVGLENEGYRLTVTHTNERYASIEIKAKDERGVRWGLATLKQLLTQCGDTLPELDIEDAPAFPIRGVMLDVSRDRVPLQDELYRIVDLLASLKYNQLQLYTEHTFAYSGHEEVWKDASPLTPSEIQALDSYCAERGVELVPNQNCFGHMERWLKHPRYAHLAETHDFWEWGGRKIPGPFSLAPLDSGSIALVDDLLTQLLPNFSSRLVNIGCDEALDVGQGRTREEVTKRGNAAIYYEFVRKVASIAQRQGYKPMYWADIALAYPESLQKISGDAIALAWGYEPDAPFAEWVQRYNEIGQEVWVCPGTSSWRSITGRTTERRGNLAAAARMAGSGATGFLVTDWGDAGHRQQWPVSEIGLVEAAEYAWNGSRASLQTMNSFGINEWLATLGDADLELRAISGRSGSDGKPTRLINSSALFNELHRPLAEPVDASQAPFWQKVLESLYDDPFDRNLSHFDVQIRDEIYHTIEAASIAAKKALLRRSPGGLKASDREDLAVRLTELTEEHRRLWLLRSRPGGLEDSCAYYQRVIADLRGERDASK